MATLVETISAVAAIQSVSIASGITAGAITKGAVAITALTTATTGVGIGLLAAGEELPDIYGQIHDNTGSFDVI